MMLQLVVENNCTDPMNLSQTILLLNIGTRTYKYTEMI